MRYVSPERRAELLGLAGIATDAADPAPPLALALSGYLDPAENVTTEQQVKLLMKINHCPTLTSLKPAMREAVQKLLDTTPWRGSPGDYIRAKTAIRTAATDPSGKLDTDALLAGLSIFCTCTGVAPADY